jgi:hypothetical protein
VHVFQDALYGRVSTHLLWPQLSGAADDGRYDIRLRVDRLDVAGLQLEALYGGFAGEPFTEDSGEYVFVARR